MIDYSKHPHKRLLAFIESGCQRIDEKRDLVGYLLSMEQARSINKLLAVYNNIYKLIAGIILGTKDLPEKWYVIETLGIDNAYLFEELNQYFNENVLNLFKKIQYQFQVEKVGLYIANLRECYNTFGIQYMILRVVEEDYSKQYKTLRKTISDHYRLRKKIELYSNYNNDNFVKSYIDNSKILAYYGRVFDIAEISTGHLYGIRYDKLSDEYKKELEEAKERARSIVMKEMERRKRKEMQMQQAYTSYPTTSFSDLFILPLFILEIVSQLIRRR